MVLLDIFLLLAVVLTVAYIRAPFAIWSISIGIVLIGITIFGKVGWFILFFSWTLFLLALIFVSLKNLRIQYFTLPLIKKLRNKMPPISETERIALEAGNVWWEKDLFCGKPNWQTLLSMPVPTLTEEEQHFLNHQVETLCNMIDDWKIVQQDHDLPEAVWEYLKNERFFGMVLPKEYGGLGFSALAHSTVVVKIATRSVSAAVNTMVPNSLGPGELLVQYGTPEQKNYYLPRLASGEDIPCFGLTSPEAGSDAGSITDSGVVCHGEYEGKTVLGIRLNWDKRYITLAPVATLLGIAFRLYDPDRLLGDVTDLGITLCLVPASLPGVEIGHRHLPLYLAFMNGPMRGKDVFVPLDAIIGGVERVGQGWKMLMECLSIGRSISLPGLSTACGKLTFRTSGAYALIRRQFNTSIANFEGIEEALGSIAGLTYTTEACRIMTADAVDQHIKPSIASAIAKYHMTEMAREMVSHAMDINAGHAIQTGPRNYLANVHMAIPVSITVEGANILTRNLIIFGQGAIRCHPYILKEINVLALPESEETTKEMDQLLMSHIGYAISNFARSFVMGLTDAVFVASPVKGSTAYFYKQLTRMSAALALLSDLSMMILGGALKRKERLSARLGDILSQLYLASAVLKYFNNLNQPSEDLCYVRWAVSMCLYKTHVAIDELLNNFPLRFLGKILRFIIFPYGNYYFKPSDKLNHEIVKKMLVPSAFRDRLTNYCFISNDSNDPIKRLEMAFEDQIKISTLWKKFQSGIRDGKLSKHLNFKDQIQAALDLNVLTSEEVEQLRAYKDLETEVIKVNEFSFNLSTVLS